MTPSASSVALHQAICMMKALALAILQRPTARARLKALIDKGLGRQGDVQRRLGRHTANIGN